jgi:Skp1 family, tetramerisation domain
MIAHRAASTLGSGTDRTCEEICRSGGKDKMQGLTEYRKWRIRVCEMGRTQKGKERHGGRGRGRNGPCGWGWRERVTLASEYLGEPPTRFVRLTFISISPFNPTMVLLVTSDNEQFVVEKDVAERSVLIKNMLEGKTQS